MKILYLGMTALTLIVLARLDEKPAQATPPTTHIAPVADAALEAKWQWAFNQAKLLHQPRFLAVYAFHTQLQENLLVWGGGSMHFSSWSRPSHERTLRTVLTEAGQTEYAAQLPDQNHHLALVWEFRSQPDGNPELVSVHANDMLLPVSLVELPVYWLGETDSAASMAHIVAAYEQADSFSARRRLISVAGLHREASVVPFLEKVLDSETHHDLRGEAVEALTWQPDDRALQRILTSARQDNSLNVREQAICALGERGGEPARDLLLELLREDGNRRVRAQAANSLARWEEKRVVEALTLALWKDPSEDVREQALDALTDDGRNPELLRRVAETHQDLDLRGRAICNLADQQGLAALPLIKGALRGAPEEVMCEAVQALESLPEEQAVPALRDVITNHRNREVRVHAIGTLSNFPTPAVLELLTKLVESPDEEEREQALDVLSEWPDDNGRKTLTTLLKKART